MFKKTHSGLGEFDAIIVIIIEKCNTYYGTYYIVLLHLD